MNIYDVYKNPVGKIYATATGVDIMSAIVTAVEAGSKPKPEILHHFYFEAVEAGSTFQINALYSGCTYEYSTDEENWTDLGQTIITLANVGDRAYIRQSSNNGYWQTGNGSSIFCFNTTGNLKVGGCISSLAYNDISHDKPDMSSTHSMSYIFDGCKTITDASDLKMDFTELTETCYDSMFHNCTSLTTAPELPATVLAENCYEHLFWNCTSLTTAPSILPATELAQQCYYEMFTGCTSLTTAPELPATEIGDATQCYYQMFMNCSNLNSITVHATSWRAPSAAYWVYNTPSTGTFTCPAELNISTGESGIPEGWTRVDL